jgi:hypothetical protein
MDTPRSKLEQAMSAQTRADAWETWVLRITAGIMFLGLILSWVLAGWSIMEGSSADPHRTQACDQTVATLLESREAVEVQRAEILIRELDCKVSRHLPKG